MTREMGVGLKYIGVTIMNKDKYEILLRLRLEIRDMKREDLDATPYMSGYTIENIIDHTYGKVMNLIDYILNDEKEWVEPNEIDDGWISVRDRLPDNKDQVMVYGLMDSDFQYGVKDEICIIGRYKKDKAKWWFPIKLYMDITHWRYLPEAPKGV